MFRQPTNEAQERPATAAAIARTLLQSLGLTADLPQRMLYMPDGRPYQVRQLGALGQAADPAVVIEEAAMLNREQPLGGWQVIIETNKQAARDRSVAAIGARLADSALTIPVRTFLSDLHGETTAVRQQVDDNLAEIIERYRQTAEGLRSWQDQHRAGGLLDSLLSFGKRLWRVVSDDEAVRLWNDREFLAMTRDAHQAASDVLATVTDNINTLRHSLDAVIAEAQAAQNKAAARRDDVARAALQGHVWDVHVHPDVVARAMTAGDDVALLPELLAAVAANGSSVVSSTAQAIARREADERVSEDVVRLLEIESKALDGDAEPAATDPIVIAGEQLLDDVRSSPTWVLNTGVRPWTATLQVTPGTEPVFDHPELSTTAYGRPDRLGFLQVQCRVALDELSVLAANNDAFRVAVRDYSQFILEDVVEAWRKEGAIPRLQSAETPPVDSQAVVALAADNDGHHTEEVV